MPSTLFLLITLSAFYSAYSRVIHIGSCTWVVDEPCNNDFVKFYLFSEKNPNTPELVSFTDTSNITNSSFNPKRPTKIIIHGYNDDQHLDVLVQMRKAYVARMDSNVWMVDWPELAKGPCYPIAAYNLRHVGQCTANMIKYLKGQGAEDIHVIGFSLGAHAAASTAFNLKPYLLPRVTGLDPALPLFALSTNKYKISPDDAHFVDIVHTNALAQGLIEPLGHVDFYMNGGSSQPGCEGDTLARINCDHHRAPAYFAESITSSSGFWGWACPSYISYLINQCPKGKLNVLMGEYVSKSLTGIIAVETKASKPFAKGMQNKH